MRGSFPELTNPREWKRGGWVWILVPRRSPSLWLLASLSWALSPLGSGCTGEASSGASGGAASAEERLVAWESESPEAPVPVALGYGHPVPDSVLVSLLTRHRLRPYSVSFVLAGTVTEQSVPRSEASLELVARTREDALGQLRVSLCAQPDRVRAMLEDSPTLLQEEGGRRVAALLTHVDRLQTELAELATGSPLFFGVEALGSLADVRSTEGEPLLTTFEPGFWSENGGERQLEVPPAELEAGWGGPEIAPEYADLDLDGLRERFQAVAAGIAGCDDVEPMAH